MSLLSQINATSIQKSLTIPFYQEARQQSEVDKITAAFNKCFECVWQKAPIPMIGQYYDEFKRSQSVFINFLKAKDDFKKALIDDPHDRKTLELFQKTLHARNAINEEAREMYARISQAKIFGCKQKHYRSPYHQEKLSASEMRQTEFVDSLKELIIKLENIQWFTPEELYLFPKYGVSFYSNL
jgi:hypothetical protein